MTTPLQDKYYLKSLHEEIDFFDRKLAHLLKYDAFPSEEDRDAAVKKMTAKRDLLASTARRMAGDGVEFKASELPRSFRMPQESTATQTAVPALLENGTADFVDPQTASEVGISPRRGDTERPARSATAKAEKRAS
jgi:hypothetical protein